MGKKWLLQDRRDISCCSCDEGWSNWVCTFISSCWRVCGPPRWGKEQDAISWYGLQDAPCPRTVLPSSPLLTLLLQPGPSELLWLPEYCLPDYLEDVTFLTCSFIFRTKVYMPFSSSLLEKSTYSYTDLSLSSKRPKLPISVILILAY